MAGKKQISFIKQLDAMDCGPTSLLMICRWYGKDLDINRLREVASLTNQGVSLLGISKAAESVGIKTIGGYISWDDLVTEEGILPLIAHWDQNHFVVVYKVKKTRKGEYIVYVADPAKGLLTYDRREFSSHWISTVSQGEERGIVLLLEPTEAFYNQEDTARHLSSRSRLRFLWSYVKNYKSYFLLLSLGLLLGSLIQLIFPFLTQSIVDVGIQGRDLGFVWLILIAQSMLLLSRTAINFIRNKILLHISTRINISLVSDFFIKLMKLPMRFFDTKLLGDLLQRIEDHQRVEHFLSSGSLQLIFSFFTFLIFGVVLLLYSWPIFIVFLLGSLLYTLWITFFLKKRRRLDYKYFEQAGRNRNLTYQLVQSMQEIKLQGCQQRKRWEWEDVQADLFKVRLEALNLEQTQTAGSVVIGEMKNILITILAAASVIEGSMTLGMMLAVQYIIGQLNSPLDQLVHFIYSWQDVSISLERMGEIHSEANEENEERAINHLPLDRTIEIKNLSFKYDKVASHYTLEDLSLKIPAGKVTAIVGASGSGKTTLIKLLLGYYSPDEGEILVGGEPLEEFNLSFWRAHTGVVMQEGYLFSDTIAGNIAISSDFPDLERVRAAARVANIADMIESLPLAYNTKIGQDGQGLSQGQRQRILISRVVYKDPAFVFLDEATNALDANNERAITEQLEKFYEDKTVVVVAHRLSTVRSADQIVVMDQGKIVEIGTHQELTQKRGYYYELVKNQLELGN